MAFFNQTVNQMTADETSAARDKNLFAHLCLLFA
jgi:hypothetical protein